MHMTFEGFPTEFVDFLFSLQFTNTVELLPENKIKYKTLITEPLGQLYSALVPTVTSISDSIVTRPAKCISSMYTDMRFSRATPLKEYMYLRFREPHDGNDVLGFYFDMGCDGYSYGIRVYKQTSAGMEKIRKGVLENSAPFIRELANLSIGMEIYGDCFARDRHAHVDNEVLKALLNKKKFRISKKCAISPAVFSGELI